MDIAKLEKMKVVDLRNELQSRGLDTKGVKAVLIERLRAYLEVGGNSGDSGVTLGTPGTPSRRGRRTRSMTRSPSPTLVKTAEPTLEPLNEEEDQQQHQQKLEDKEQIDEDIEKNNEQAAEINNAAEESDDGVDDDEMYDEEIRSTEQSNYVHSDAEYENEQQQVTANDQADDEKEQEDDNDNNGDQDQDSEAIVKQTNGNDTNENLMEVEQANNIERASDEDHQKHEDSKDNAGHKSDKHNRRDSNRNETTRKRAHSTTRSRSESRVRSSSHSSKKRGGRGAARDTSKASNDAERVVPEDEPSIDEKRFGLSWVDSDLHLRIDPVTFSSAKPLSHEIYSLVWSGARSNYGVRAGKVCFEVRLSEETSMGRSHQFRDEPHVRGFRIGFSKTGTTLLLGETEHSYAYCESGRKASNSEFTDYAKSYQLDDVIGCYLDLESTPCTIKYTLNGEDLGTAYEFEKSILDENEALFPHVLTKGYEYVVNFTDAEQLLVNAKRPIRKRRKPRKEYHHKEDDNDMGKWKVLDEATADDDDEQQLKKDDENLQDEIEKANKNEKSRDPNKQEATVKKDSDIKQENNTIGEDVEMREANKDNTNTAEETADENAGAQNASEKDSLIAAPTAKAESENGAADAKATAVAVGGDDAAGTTTEQENANNQQNEEPEDHEDDDPSPNKRARIDDKSKHTENSEDEYEEIVPVPRETAALLLGYILIAVVPDDQLIAGPQRAQSRKECEVILLVGLPGSGKTHWTKKHIADNPDKRYDVIGPDSIMAKMTIDGAARRTVHKGRWERVYELCLNSLGSLEEIGMKRRRNYILDQTNAYASAQRRKMKGFAEFKRIAVVCVPNDDELKRRLNEKGEQGNAFTVKESTINNLRANFTLPSLEFGWFDDIIYADLKGDEARDEVKKYNEKGKKAIDAERSTRDKQRNRRGGDHYRRDDRNRRYGDDRRRDYGGRHNDNRWHDSRRGGSGNYGSGGGGRWGHGGGGGGGGGGYRMTSGGGGGWRDERSYGGGGGGGGAGGRGYDNRGRYNQGGGGGGGAQQNWMQNNRNRYDDRYGRSGGGGGGRYDHHGGGGGGSSRDYRDRDRCNDRNRSSNNYRSGGGNNNQQRDFRPGHRDTKEDSRGGYERSAANMPKYNNNAASVAGYEHFGKSGIGSGASGKSSVQSGKWSTYAQHQQTQQQQSTTGGSGSGSIWQQQQTYAPQQQQQVTGQQQQQQQYWGYNQMQGYVNQQQGWQNTDANQQQQWMSWWQQQNNATNPQAQVGNTGASNVVNESATSNQYWSQYSTYSTQGNIGAGDGKK